MTPLTRRRFVQYAAAAVAVPAVAAAESFDPAALKRLASQFAGSLITPQSPEYESLRRVFNRAFDKHPALIARCANAQDVVRALVFARERGLPIAVRGGGHNRAGLSVCDGGVVIDLANLHRVDVDVAKRVAHVGAGALTIQLDTATQRYGLATTLAGCPTVGVAGLTLGGGEGLLMSKYGAACDNLRSAQLVSADGKLLEASEKSNPDLFWAIRGGGGNFGIATALEYQLHPVSTVLAGTLSFAPGRTAQMLEAFAKFVAKAPDEMNVVGVLQPSEIGARFQMLVCHCGDPTQGSKLLAPLRALTPSEDKIRVAPYLQINANINPAAPTAHFQTNVFLPRLDAATIARIASATHDAPPNTRVFMVPIYGAIARVKPDATAFALRSVGFELDLMGHWDETGKDQERAIEWVKSLRDELRPRATGAYVNQLGETSERLVTTAYGENYPRLTLLKAKYDPDNAFRSNQNIQPT
jgi:FAD/FMN-containing dehydrogenase